MLITKDMSLADIVDQWPVTVGIFKQYGMGCLGCAIAHFETLEQGVMAHQIDLDSILCDLNAAATSNGPGECQSGCHTN